MPSFSGTLRCVLIAALFLGILLTAIPPVAAAADGNIQVYLEPSNVIATACVDQHCQNTAMTAEGEGATFTGFDSNAWHTLTIKADGYLDYSSTFYLTPGTQVIDAYLDPVPTPTPVPNGNLEIEVSPKGGTACIDNAQCQRLDFDPNADGVFDFYSLAGNSYHTLAITLPGYQPYTESIYVNAGIDNGESVKLTPLAQGAASSSLQATAASNPAGAGTPVSTAPATTAVPQTTKTGLSASVPFVALGIVGAVFLARKR